MPAPLALRINGTTRELMLPPETPLLYALRNDLNLKAAKYGCGSEQCGACAVLVDGVAVPSCQLPLGHCQGLDIITLEGLAKGDALHPLQETFLEEQAAQCGFCSAGMIVAAQGLLNRIRYPSDDDIRSALTGNLCRCGVYDRVRRAIKLRTGRIEPPMVEVIDCPPLDDCIEASSLSLQAHPQLDDWLRIEPDGRITLFSGKVELGQGIATALAQIAADELDVALWRIDVVCADTERTPDEGGTTGSRSLESSGVAIRCAAAEARQHLLSLAYEALDSLTPAEQLQVQDGVISDPSSGRGISYWELQGGKLFNRRISGSAPQKEPSAHSLVGHIGATNRPAQQIFGRRQLCARYVTAGHAARACAASAGLSCAAGGLRYRGPRGVCRVLRLSCKMGSSSPWCASAKKWRSRRSSKPVI